MRPIHTITDSELLSNLKQIYSPPTAQKHANPMRKSTKKCTKHASGATKSSSARGPKCKSADDKDANRRHKALERQFTLAQQKAQTSGHQRSSLPELSVPDSATQPHSLFSGPQGLPPGIVTPHRPNVAGSHGDPAPSLAGPAVESHAHPQERRSAPEATFTPTAAGLHAGEGPHPGLPCDIQTVISETISRTLMASAQQGAHLSSMSAAPPPHVDSYVNIDLHDSSQQDSVHGEDSLLDDDDHRDMEFSDNEGMLPDRPAFTGLFRLSLFKSLLHKAKRTTNLATSVGQPDQEVASHPHDELFTVPKTEQNFIPCPQLFTEVIKWPWNLPGSLVVPNGLDKKLYCSAPCLQLQWYLLPY